MGREGEGPVVCDLGGEVLLVLLCDFLDEIGKVRGGSEEAGDVGDDEVGGEVPDVGG